MTASDLRNRVVLDMLVERLLPPFAPPPAGFGSPAALLGVTLLALMLMGGIAGQGDGYVAPALLVTLVVAALCAGVMVALAHRRRARRRAYIARYMAAYDRAQRLLAGTARPEWGDSEAALASDVRVLADLQAR